MQPVECWILVGHLQLQFMISSDKGEVFKGWKESERPGYKGMHGLKIPVFGQ